MERKNTAMEIIQTRRSIRKFTSEPVPETAIRRMLEAAHAAPSAHNTHPWRFVVLRDGGARRRLAENMAAAYARDAGADGVDPEKIRSRNARSVERITAAPLAILACADVACLPAAAGRSETGERLLLAQSVAAALENMLLAAEGERLGACWLGAPAFCPQAVTDSLALPETWVAQALVLIGFPAETPAKPAGPALSEVVQWR